MDFKRGMEHEVEIEIPSDRVMLDGDLYIPENAGAIILFAHGSGSGRLSPRNRQVAQYLNQASFATLLFDLLTKREEAADTYTAALRFDIDLLARRLTAATDWVIRQKDLQNFIIGYFGASTGAAAALIAAAGKSNIKAIVSRGGRPDLAGDSLSITNAPTLLIAGGEDYTIIDLNREALEKLRTSEKKLEIVPGATHLFEEPGALDEVARLAADWFRRYLLSENTTISY